MRVLVSGSRGLIGRSIIPRIMGEGHRVIKLKRRRVSVRKSSISWIPDEEFIEMDKMDQDPIDVVIHLAGESLIGKWNSAKKEAIRSSRVEGTALLADAMAHLKLKPKLLICASAVGYYGDRGEELVDESSPRGDGFLAEVCEDWEGATQSARDAGIRVVNARFGIVLSNTGGMMNRVQPIFNMGLGGRIGSGTQYMSWVAIHDIIDIIMFFIHNDHLEGPFNVCAPEPVTNREFTKSLGKAMRRPTLFPAPASALRMLYGEEMANEVLLSSTRAFPTRLIDAGYEFYYEELQPCLATLLRR